MTMATEEIRALRDSLTRFDNALERVDALAQKQNRQRIIIWVLSGVLGALLIAGSIGIFDLVKVQRNTDADNARNATILLEACQARNATNVIVRKRFDNFYKALDSLATSDSFRAFVVNLKQQDVALGEIKDRDCTGDGNVDTQDYPVDGGP
jgi:hypothetical protein